MNISATRDNKMPITQIPLKYLLTKYLFFYIMITLKSSLRYLFNVRCFYRGMKRESGENPLQPPLL